MIKNGYYYCDCGKKLQTVDEKTTVIANLYCRHCKSYSKVLIINGELIKSGRLPMEEVNTSIGKFVI